MFTNKDLVVSCDNTTVMYWLLGQRTFTRHSDALCLEHNTLILECLQAEDANTTQTGKLGPTQLTYSVVVSE